MNEHIEFLISKIKEQYMWRAEDNECGGNEAEEAWDMYRYALIKDLETIPDTSLPWNRDSVWCDVDNEEK